MKNHISIPRAIKIPENLEQNYFITDDNGNYISTDSFEMTCGVQVIDREYAKQMKPVITIAISKGEKLERTLVNQNRTLTQQALIDGIPILKELLKSINVMLKNNEPILIINNELTSEIDCFVNLFKDIK